MRERTFKLQALVARVEKAEKQARRLRLAVSLLFLFVGSVIIIGQALPNNKVIEADKFVLRGLNGKVRAELNSDKDGTPLLTFYDKEGKQRTKIGLLPNDIPALIVNGKDEKSVVFLGVKDDIPTLTLNGSNDEAIIGLAVGIDGESILSFNDKKGKPRCGIKLGKNGVPSIDLFDNNGKAGVSLEVSKEGEPTLDMRDSTGSIRASLNVPNNGSTSLDLTDKEGKAGVSLGVLTDGNPSFGLMDGEGNLSAFIGLEKKSSPILILKEKDHKSGVALGFMKEGIIGLTITGKQGKPRAGLSLLKDDSAIALSLADKDGTVLAGVGIAPNGSPTIGLHGKDGRLLFKAP